jgi:hypothetical protein
MQNVGQFGWETGFIHALRTHLNVVIPCATLLVKILVRTFSRDEIKEVIRSVFNLPLELMLIAMSFMLAALSGLLNGYIARFPKQSDADLYAAIVVGAIFFVSIPVNKLNRFSMIVAEKLYIAIKQYGELSKEPLLPGTEPSRAILGRIMWAMLYCILMVLVILLSFGIAISALAYVLHLVQ